MTDEPIGDEAGGPTVPGADDAPDRTETARFLVPALVLVVVVGVAAAGAGLLVPASSLNDTGLVVVRVVGVVAAVGGLLMLCGPWRSSARVGLDRLPVVLALAALVVVMLALVSIPTSPVTLGSDDDRGGGTLAGSGSGSGSGLGDDDTSGDGGYGDGGDGASEGRGVWVDSYVVIGDEYLRLLDLDGDGVVTLDELDVDGDGVIRVGELDRATGKLVVDGDDLGDLDVDDLDLDGNGKLDLGEVDVNGDGVVDLEDLDRDGDGVIRVDDVDYDGDINFPEVGESDDSDEDDDRGDERGERTTTTSDKSDDEDDERSSDEDEDDDSPDLSWLGPVVLAVALLGAVLAAILWGRDMFPRWRRGRPVTVKPLPEEEPPVDADAAQAGLSASLATVAAGDDPRAAIVNAYLQLLESLAAAGGERRPEEAPHEHLYRVLGPLGVRPEPTHRLAELFVMARFSPHPIEEHHRDEAASLLHAALADLHAHMAATAAAAVPVEAGHAP